MEKKKPDTRQKNINPLEVVQLKEKGLSNADIGKIVGCTRENVRQLINRYAPELAELKVFNEKKAEIYEGIQAKIAMHITDDKLDKMSVRDAVISMGVLEDKARLIRGQSTENISIKQRLKRIADIDAEIEELERMLKEDDGAVDDESNKNGIPE